MFDLKFFAYVSAVMGWTKETPPLKFANFHQSHVNQRASMAAQMHYFKALTEEQYMMRAYIIETYLPYFGLKFNIGNYESRNMDTVVM